MEAISMFLLHLFVSSCVSAPLEHLNIIYTDEPSSIDTYSDSDDGSTDVSNDLEFNIGTKRQDVRADGYFDDDEDSLVGPDFSSTDLNEMEVPDNETEDKVDAQVNEEILNFLKKPIKTNLDKSELLGRLLKIYIENASKEVRFGEIFSKILAFMKNPDAKEVDLLKLYKDATRTEQYSGDSDDLEDDSITPTDPTPPPTIATEPEEVATNVDLDTTSPSTVPEFIIEVDDLERESTKAITPSSNEIVDIPEDLADPLDFLTDPMIPKALNATKKLNALQSEQRNRTTIEIAGGFKFLNMASQFQRSKGLKKKHLVRIVKKDLNDFVGRNENLTEIVETLGDYVDDDTRDDFLFSVISEVIDGHVKAIFVNYKKRNDGRYDLKRLKFSGNANLAASLVITRITTEDATSVQSNDVITYLPGKGVTRKQMSELFDIMLPELGNLLGSFSFDQKPKGFMSEFLP